MLDGVKRNLEGIHICRTFLNNGMDFSVSPLSTNHGLIATLLFDLTREANRERLFEEPFVFGSFIDRNRVSRLHKLKVDNYKFS